MLLKKASLHRFAELETCFTEQSWPDRHPVENSTIELTNNDGVNNMTSLVVNELTINHGPNLTSLVLMVPRVCPTDLRKSHWYTRYDTI